MESSPALAAAAESAAPLNADTASRPRRIVAFCFDRALLFAVVSASLLSSQRRVPVLLCTLCTLALQAALLGTTGQSLGKRLLRLQVVDAETSVPAGVLRTVLVRGMLFLGLSLVPMVNLGALCNALSLFRRSRRCLHDEAAGTQVRQLSAEQQAQLDAQFTARWLPGTSAFRAVWAAAYTLPVLAVALLAFDVPGVSARVAAGAAWIDASLKDGVEEATPATSRTDYQALRAGFRTQLTRQGPAPQSWSEEPLPERVTQVLYPSQGLQLKGYVREPETRNDPAPVLVYLHGGFALSVSDLDDCEAFSAAGFVVFAPTYRGENGNPGNFELFMGEVDDARAAVEWVAQQPFTAPHRIYVFGHSAGAGVAELLTLFSGGPIALSGSSGGLYLAPEALVDEPPFDPQREHEKELRKLLGNLASMQRRHVAYLGTEEREVAPYRAAIQAELPHGARLELRAVPGDHFTSLGPAMIDFLGEIGEESAEQAGSNGAPSPLQGSADDSAQSSEDP